MYSIKNILFFKNIHKLEKNKFKLQNYILKTKVFRSNKLKPSIKKKVYRKT